MLPVLKYKKSPSSLPSAFFFSSTLEVFLALFNSEPCKERVFLLFSLFDKRGLCIAAARSCRSSEFGSGLADFTFL
uniref:Uncharacterized protein n=1 Tax=Rhizophora mucronata TaxID=61149 RepID=A0A2P2R439_RHIMU